MIEQPCKIYQDWLIECVEGRKWTWPRIALCLVHWIRQHSMTRLELIDKLKHDYRKAAEQRAETK